MKYVINCRRSCNVLYFGCSLLNLDRECNPSLLSLVSNISTTEALPTSSPGMVQWWDAQGIVGLVIFLFCTFYARYIKQNKHFEHFFFFFIELLLLSVYAFKMHKDNLKYITTSAAVVNWCFLCGVIVHFNLTFTTSCTEAWVDWLISCVRCWHL